jgi:UDP-2,3-diacylglucosamine pyrophosphatase LpxH
LLILNLIKAYEAIVILRVKVNKQLDGKANGIIESCQEIISELCSILERGDCAWMVGNMDFIVEEFDGVKSSAVNVILF